MQLKMLLAMLMGGKGEEDETPQPTEMPSDSPTTSPSSSPTTTENEEYKFDDSTSLDDIMAMLQAILGILGDNGN